MLSILHPEVCQEVLHYPAGLHAFRIRGEATPSFIVKMPPQFLLTAKMNKGFKVYVVPVSVSNVATIGLISAFFDDPDSPLILWSPLANEVASKSLIHALLSATVNVHLFDEHNRELLGYEAKVHVPLKARELLEHAKFIDLTHELANDLHDAGRNWFSVRGEADDLEAISIEFCEPLFPENIVITDMRPDQFQFHGAKGVNQMSLVKSEPGQYQEIDIILLLSRIFPVHQIFHAPKRIYDKEEIADVLVITDNACIIIQAKDSPNTEDVLRQTLERKHLKAIKQLKGGISQASGAINYLLRVQPFRMLIDDAEVEIDLGRKQILSLIVVRELFLDDYLQYSKLLSSLFQKIELPCIALDYSGLHEFTTYCETEHAFVGAYFEVFDHLQKTGVFPRLRFGMKDLFREDGSFKF